MDGKEVYSFGQLVRVCEPGPLPAATILRVELEVIANLPDGVTVAYADTRDVSQPGDAFGHCLLTVAYDVP